MLSKHCNSLYMLLPEDIVITCRQCQRPTLEGEACLCAATALTRGPRLSRCKVPTVARADRSLQGTTVRNQPQCRRLLAAASSCGRVVHERELENVGLWEAMENWSILAISRFGQSQPSFVGLATGPLRIRYCSATLFRGRCGGEKRRAVLF